MDAKFHSGRLPLRESGWSEVRNRLIVGNQTNLCARQTRIGKSSLTAAYRHGWLSFGCRCASAAWTIAKDSRRHLSQKGDDLPGARRRIIEQARLLFSSGLTATNYYSYRLYREEMPQKDKALFLGFFEGWRWQMAVNRDR